MKGHCYTFAGGKGGVGKTTTAINTAYALADLGHGVVLVDADLAMTNLAAMLDSDHKPTLHDVLADEASLENAIDQRRPVAIVPGDPTLENYLDIDLAGLGQVIKRLRTAFDIVLVDTGAGVHHETMVPCGAADGVILVTTPDDVAVADTKKTAELVETVDGRVLGVVVTRADHASAQAVAADLDTNLLTNVPDQPRAVETEPVVETDPDSEAAGKYTDAAVALSVARESAVEATKSDQEPLDLQ